MNLMSINKTCNTKYVYIYSKSVFRYSSYSSFNFAVILFPDDY